jgi:hypothetical protein
VALTTQRTRFVALPLAIVVLMGCVVAVGSGGLLPASGLSPFVALSMVVGGFVVFFGLMLGVVRLFRNALITPRMRRT